MFNAKKNRTMKKYFFALVMFAIPALCSAQTVETRTKQATVKKIDQKTPKTLQTPKKEVMAEPVMSTSPAGKKVTTTPKVVKTEPKKADGKELKNAARPTNATKMKEIK